MDRIDRLPFEPAPPAPIDAFEAVAAQESAHTGILASIRLMIEPSGSILRTSRTQHLARWLLGGSRGPKGLLETQGEPLKAICKSASSGLAFDLPRICHRSRIGAELLNLLRPADSPKALT